jgi:uncharacterized protein (UPF0264 family)
VALRDLVPVAHLHALVERARARGLLCGLAGSLAAEDVDALAPLRPHILGFRGALCVGGAREATVLPAAVRAIRATLDRCLAERIGSAPPSIRRASDVPDAICDQQARR